MTGLIFSDGSCLHPTFPALRRTGWALAQMDQQGNIEAIASGPCPKALCPHQTIPEAEDFAAAKLRETALPPVTLFPDCLNTVRAVNAEGWQQKRAAAPRAHLWASYAATFEGAGIVAEHIRGHATAEMVADGRSSWWRKKGNDEADKWAKIGAAMHPLPPEKVAEYKALFFAARSLCTYLAGSAVHTAEKQTLDTEQLGVEKEARVPERIFELVISDAQASKTVPPGYPDGQIAVHPFNGHHLVAANVLDELGLPDFEKGLVWCRRCGAYCSATAGFRSRPCALLEPCANKSARQGLKLQLARAQRGQHPAHSNQVELQLRISPPFQLSPWQALALEVWKPQIGDMRNIGPSEVSRDGGGWAAEMSRNAVLIGFGLTEESLAERIIQLNKDCQPTEDPDSDSG